MSWEGPRRRKPALATVAPESDRRFASVQSWYDTEVAGIQPVWPVREFPSWPNSNGVPTSSIARAAPSGRCSGCSVPRHTHQPRSKKRSSAKPERGGSSRRQRVSAPEIDARVLAFREDGTSFSTIARLMELERAVDAHRCFVRALNAHQGEDRRRLVGNEELRLDRLEARIRDRDAADATKIARRLRGVTNLRVAMAR